MHIVFQNPEIGDYEHNYQWALVAPSGDAVSFHYSPEAALLSAAGELKIDVDRLRLVRDGANRFDVEHR